MLLTAIQALVTKIIYCAILFRSPKTRGKSILASALSGPIVQKPYMTQIHLDFWVQSKIAMILRPSFFDTLAHDKDS